MVRSSGPYGETDGGHPRSVFSFTEPSNEKLDGTFSGTVGSSVVNTGPLAVTADAVFLGAVNTGRIVRCPLDVARAAALSTSFRSHAQPLAADDKAVYYVAIDDAGAGADAGVAARIMKVAR